MHFNCVTNCLWFWRLLHLVHYSTQYNLCSKHFCCTTFVWNSVRWTTGFFNKNIDRRMIERFHVCFYSLLLTNHPIMACFAFKQTNHDFHSLKNVILCMWSFSLFYLLRSKYVTVDLVQGLKSPIKKVNKLYISDLK